MAFITIADYVADGLADTFAVPFPFLAEPHVIVTVDGAPVVRTFNSPQVVQLSETPTAGQEVRVRRQTPIDRLLVVVNSRSSVRSTELNQLSTQLLYIIQESFDASLDFQNSLLDRTIELSVAGNRLAAGDRSAPFVVGQALQLPAGLSGSRFATLDLPMAGDANISFNILRNSTVIGDFSIDAVGAVAVNFPSTITFARGDIISFTSTGAAAESIGATIQGILI